MKVACVVYPGMNLFDLISLSEPLRQLGLSGIIPDLEIDYCAPDAMPVSLERAAGILAGQVKTVPDLSTYDVLAVPGGATDVLDGRREVYRAWLNTARLVPVVAGIGIGAALLDSAGLQDRPEVRPAPVTLLGKYSAETMEVGFQLCERLAGLPARRQVERVFGYSIDQLLQPQRLARVSRETHETRIEVELALDGAGKHSIQTGIGFLNHMLTQVAVHGMFDLAIAAQGDLEVDAHHTIEDVALTLGKAFDQALGDRKGLVRMASATVPMDESLAQVNLDFSGRPYAVVNVDWYSTQVGGFSTTLITHFIESFAMQSRCNIHVRLLAGGDDHHRAEAIFKALGRALDAATQLDPRRLDAIPSSKGML